VRQDENIGGEISKSEAWDQDPQTGIVDDLLDARVEAGDEMVDGKLRVHSLSGHERNKLYSMMELLRTFQTSLVFPVWTMNRIAERLPFLIMTGTGGVTSFR
jgi:hypothetical protein